MAHIKMYLLYLLLFSRELSVLITVTFLAIQLGIIAQSHTDIIPWLYVKEVNWLKKSDSLTNVNIIYFLVVFVIGVLAEEMILFLGEDYHMILIELR